LLLSLELGNVFPILSLGLSSLVLLFLDGHGLLSSKLLGSFLSTGLLLVSLSLALLSGLSSGI
jgi:hypothetical protein